MTWTSYPVNRMQGEIIAPSDKSCSHRAIIFAALARGESKLSGILEGEDVLRTVDAMRKLGTQIQKLNNGDWIVDGKGGLRDSKETLNFGNSGTGCRLTLGAIAGFPIVAEATGDISLRSRPMNRIIEPLSKMGASFKYKGNGRLPLSIRGSKNLSAISHRSVIASAQVKSAILLAGLNADGETIVKEPQLSRDHTERMLTTFGGVSQTSIDTNGHACIRIQGQQTLTATDTNIPGDPSSAAFLVACGLLGSSRKIEISNVMLNPTRRGFLEVVEQMGGIIRILSEEVVSGEKVGTLLIESSNLQGVEIPRELVSSTIDEFPILSVLASFAKGETIVTSAKELRVKESDRISSIVAMLRVNGVEIEERKDGFTIMGCDGSPKGGGLVKTCNDHRIGMSALVLGTATQNPVSLDDVSMITTSYPSFLADMNKLGACIEAGGQ